MAEQGVLPSVKDFVTGKTGFSSGFDSAFGSANEVWYYQNDAEAVVWRAPYQGFTSEFALPDFERERSTSSSNE